ncbi:zona pellucida sperm-binding protein 4-like [Anabas testudineus]|uniref:zona pellucida sperm-binding protein 4-like n=1 Tax=Anabas testudineus TaxID=64144 RepID=UPI000E45DFD5|nr:zona pellucida sperm-binding protein 4-like [Anabas testudineus]
MKTYSADVVLVTFISLSLLLLTFEANVVYNPVNNNTTICHSGFMSVYISKVQFADLPFTVYVHDEHGRYYQAVAIAKQCHYFFGETDAFIILTVAANGCFVRRQKYFTSLTVVIVAPADKGNAEIVKTVFLVCETETKETHKKDYPPELMKPFCNKDGFNITILQNAVVPTLNLDEVRIPSSQSHNCKPKTTSSDAVTFRFTFTDCGTQSVIVDGIITYWINIEGRHLQKGTIFRDTPFYLTVHCSFALAQRSPLSFEVQQEKYSTLKSEGVLRTEMRFAKDSSYTSFYSSRDRQTMMELGQSVYVEIYILKHEHKDLVLRLGDCWATPTQDPHDQQRWNLLVKGYISTAILRSVKDQTVYYTPAAVEGVKQESPPWGQVRGFFTIWYLVDLFFM